MENGNYSARISERTSRSIEQPSRVLTHGALNTLLQGIRECRYVSVSRWTSENLSQRIATREFILELMYVHFYQCTIDFTSLYLLYIYFFTD